MNVCQSFCLKVFFELALVFPGTQYCAKGPCGVVHDRAIFFEHIFAPKIGKVGQA